MPEHLEVRNLRVSLQRAEGAREELPGQHLPLGDGHASVPGVAEVLVNPVEQVSVHPLRVPASGCDALSRGDRAPLQVPVVGHGPGEADRCVAA